MRIQQTQASEKASATSFSRQESLDTSGQPSLCAENGVVCNETIPPGVCTKGVKMIENLKGL